VRGRLDGLETKVSRPLAAIGRDDHPTAGDGILAQLRHALLSAIEPWTANPRKAERRPRGGSARHTRRLVRVAPCPAGSPVPPLPPRIRTHARPGPARAHSGVMPGPEISGSAGMVAGRSPTSPDTPCRAAGGLYERATTPPRTRWE